MCKIVCCLLVCDLERNAQSVAYVPPGEFLHSQQTSLINHQSVFPTGFILNIRILLNTVHKF